MHTIGEELNDILRPKDLKSLLKEERVLVLAIKPFCPFDEDCLSYCTPSEIF